MKAKTQEARLVEGMAALREDSRFSVTKTALLSILLKSFIDTQGEGKKQEGEVD